LEFRYGDESFGDYGCERELDAGGTYPYAWDVENRLLSSMGKDYGYDRSGKRITTSVNGVTIVYFYGITGQKVQTCTSGGNHVDAQFLNTIGCDRCAGVISDRAGPR
jgi:hypothetical protein